MEWMTWEEFTLLHWPQPRWERESIQHTEGMRHHLLTLWDTIQAMENSIILNATQTRLHKNLFLSHRLPIHMPISPLAPVRIISKPVHAARMEWDIIALTMSRLFTFIV